MPVSARVAFVLSDRTQISLSGGVWVSANVKRIGWVGSINSAIRGLRVKALG